MINCTVLMGRLVADPELRHTQNDISVTSFTIAVDRSYTPKGQERQADFINIVAWRQNAEFICRYFKKGQLIAIQGSIQTRKYTDKNGNNRTAFEVVADKTSFCGKENTQGRYEKPAKANVDIIKDKPSDDFEDISDDMGGDLPF